MPLSCRGVYTVRGRGVPAVYPYFGYTGDGPETDPGVGVRGVVVVKRIAAPGPVDMDREVSEVLVVVDIGLTKRLDNRWTGASGVVGEGLAEDHPLDRESGGHQYEAGYLQVTHWSVLFWIIGLSRGIFKHSG